jgi:hypothetical protein
VLVISGERAITRDQQAGRSCDQGCSMPEQAVMLPLPNTRFQMKGSLNGNCGFRSACPNEWNECPAFMHNAIGDLEKTAENQK